MNGAIRRAVTGLGTFAALLLGSSSCSDVEEARSTPEREPAAGRLKPLRAPGVPSDAADAHDRRVARLQALGYSGAGVSSTKLAGVIRHDRERVHPGWNLYTSGHAPVAILTDLEGRVHHRWSRSFSSVWPEREEEASSEQAGHWRKVRLLEGGDLIAIFEGLGILRLDRASNVRWASPAPAHHDLEVLPDGELYVLLREVRVVPRVGGEYPVLEEFVARMGADGVERRRVSILDAILASPWASLLAPEEVAHPAGEGLRFDGDLLHTNALRVLPRGWGEELGVRGGEVLLSIRHLDALAILDLEQGRVVWLHRGRFRRQHDPRPLENGNLLCFANNPRSGRSRVLEIVPRSGRVAWSYEGTAEDPFFSKLCGAAQRLPNGNTLITETDNGRAFEVTVSGEVVWELWNPYRAGAEGELIASIFEAERVDRGRVKWLAGIDAE